jgi:hypothetical protein
MAQLPLFTEPFCTLCLIDVCKGMTWLVVSTKPCSSSLHRCLPLNRFEYKIEQVFSSLFSASRYRLTMYNSDDIESIKSRVDLPKFVERYAGQGKRSGSTTKFHSPLRSGDDDPSFAVKANRFKDFGGGGESGDIFDFVKLVEHLTFPEALDYLRREVGISESVYASRSMRPSMSSTPIELPAQDWQSAAQSALAECQRILWSPEGRDVLSYLRKGRGLSDETIRQAGLGYNPGWMTTGYSFCIEGEEEKQAKLAPGIVIPWYFDGQLWALRIRCRVGAFAQWLHRRPDRHKNGEEFPKYIHFKASKTGIAYNGEHALAERDVLIVEGEFDCLLAQQELGESVVVMTLGSASSRLASEWQERLLGARSVYSALDSDNAGRQATKKLDAVLGDKHVALTLPTSKDITEFVVEHGGNLRAWFDQRPHPCWWPKGMPDSWRSGMLNYLRPSCVPVLELLNDALRQGAIDGQAIRIPDVLTANQDLGYRLPESTIRKAVKELCFLFLQKTLPITMGIGDSLCRNASPKGRKAEVYRVLPLLEARAALLERAGFRIFEHSHPVSGESAVLADFKASMLHDAGIESAETKVTELIETLQGVYAEQDNQRAVRRARRDYKEFQETLENDHSTPLPSGWPLGSPADYRATYLRGVVEADSTRCRSNWELQKLFGLTKSGVKATLKRAGVKNEHQFVERKITSPTNVQEQIRKLQREVKGYPSLTSIQNISGFNVQYSYCDEDCIKAITECLASGGAVTIRFQTASRQYIDRETPLEKLEREPKANTEFANAPVEVQKPVKSQPKPYYAPSFNPDWVRHQLWFALQLLKETEEGDDENPDLLEPLPPDMSTGELLTLVLETRMYDPIGP